MLRVRVSAQCNRCMHMDSHQKEAWTSVICAICTMYAVCFPCYYFGSSWNFQWHLWWFLDSLIDGIRFLPLWSCSSLDLFMASQIFLVWERHVFLVLNLDLNFFVLHELLGILYHWFWLVNKFKLNIYHCQTYFCQDYLNCSLEFCMCQMRLVWYHCGCCHHYSVAIGNCLKSCLLLS